MNVAVCDDEDAVRKQLSALIAVERGVEAVSEFSTADELLASPEHYDLLFLDIQMPGVDGVEAARQLRARNSSACIVFVTGVKEYVFDAFDVGALHYLLKPVDPAKFAEVFERARAECLRYDASQEKKLLIRTRTRTETLSSSEILYAESQLKKLAVHTQDRTIEYYGRINELERQLGDTFYRCHRGYLVNMAYIAGYDGDSITLTNGERIYLAKERYADFVKSYLRYLRNGGACFA